MTTEAVHAVALNGQRLGSLLQRGDVARFVFEDDYWSDPARGVLGMWFEDNPRRSPRAALRLPEWFSNLLPEGPLRQWIARDRAVSVDRELQLLLQIGHDLPGAVTVVPDPHSEVDVRHFAESPRHVESPREESFWKFSLAGVGLKFSLLKQGDRLTIPAVGEAGDWIVKFPDAAYEKVPETEFATMSLAHAMGIDVPEIRLVHRDELPCLPDLMWRSTENLAFAIKRFDRTAGGKRIHIEDFAQVRGFYPEGKYQGSFETVAALAYRGEDLDSLQEVIRRLTFNLLVGNDDAHLKNWSFLYADQRTPRLSPAYDLVSTAPYSDGELDIGLKLGGTKDPHRVRRDAFVRLATRLQIDPAVLLEVVDETTNAFFRHWADGAAKAFPARSRTWIDEHAPQMRILLRGRSR
ncbi:type II toxin-antitoxin system HipA family toxin [Brachybacterium kimchii]|uniref:Type II toxin-antitoxin system HipA family toxin n=1 Tax=Brachybacterium kimchii TaxID=2942909 RepID=A0ABY4NA99_9MICO|nr:type II toxin-antitoxin system HipA family toxin [Brachybacterium kimchii]UQN31461.1 type II toxin-antitoxin system HipA family toxin [Brachybacterium kimchii]